MLRQVIFSFVVLATVSDALLTFKLTIDKRLVNEQGKINPVNFTRDAYKAVKPYQNSTDEQQLTVMMNFVRGQYGQEKAALIEKLIKALQEISKQLPASVQSAFNKELELLNNETVQIDYTFQKVQSQISPGKIYQRIEKEIIPLVKKIFYNPFDEIANSKLPPQDVIVIEHTFF